MVLITATILTEPPPLRARWSLVGRQAVVPITGNRGWAVQQGALNSATGERWLDEAARTATHCRWVLEVVCKRPGHATFVVQKKRWAVERTFGWFNRYRRPSKDHERNPRSSEAWIYIARIIACPASACRPRTGMMTCCDDRGHDENLDF